MNLDLQSQEIQSVIAVASFLFVIILNALTLMFFVSFRRPIFGDKTLQIPLRLSTLIMNGYYLSSTGFKSTRAGLKMHASPINDTHSVWSATRAKELLKLSNAINTCLIKLYNILYYALPLNTCDCLISHIYQWKFNRQKNHTHFHLKIFL